MLCITYRKVNRVFECLFSKAFIPAGFSEHKRTNELFDLEDKIILIDKLSECSNTKGFVVVLDAGIATEDNLMLLSKKGYKYLCVSRSTIRDYEVIKGRLTTLLETKSKQPIQLKTVNIPRNTDYYLETQENL